MLTAEQESLSFFLSSQTSLIKTTWLVWRPSEYDNPSFGQAYWYNVDETMSTKTTSRFVWGDMVEWLLSELEVLGSNQLIQNVFFFPWVRKCGELANQKLFWGNIQIEIKFAFASIWRRPTHIVVKKELLAAKIKAFGKSGSRFDFLSGYIKSLSWRKVKL